MSTVQWAYPLLRAIHVLCALIWVGGMFFIVVVLRPSLAYLEISQQMILQTQVLKRFFLTIWHAMPLLILTGSFMLPVFTYGVKSLPWQIHTMLGLGILMAGLFVVSVLGPYRRFRRTSDRSRMVRNLESVQKLTSLGLFLGLIVVIVGSLL